MLWRVRYGARWRGGPPKGALAYRLCPTTAPYIWLGAPPGERSGATRQELWGARTSTHHLLALGCIRCLCVCCLAEHLLSRAVAWQSCRAHPAPPRPRPLPRPEGEGPQAGGNNTASHAPPPGTLRIAEHPLNTARRRSNDLIVRSGGRGAALAGVSRDSSLQSMRRRSLPASRPRVGISAPVLLALPVDVPIASGLRS